MKRALILVVFAGLLASSTPAAPAKKAANSGTRAMIAARRHFFGKRNVDPKTGKVRSDKVILSWFSVASFAASFNGHVVLLDAWVARGSHSGYVPTTPEEVAALDPEYIFIGHGDFDHDADAAQIASLSGAPIVGSPEHCDSIRKQAGKKLECFKVTPPNPSPGYKRELPPLIPGVDITAVVHVHSSVERPEGDHLPCPPLWNAGDTAEHPPSPEDMEHLFRHLPDARGANILYQFRVGKFALAHHDTTGKIDDNPLIGAALRSLPPTDVDFGSVLAFGQVTNCFRSLGLYLRALKPKVYAAMHHDNFTYFLGANAKDLEPYVREELSRLPKKIRPDLLYSYDPKDYLNHSLWTFDPKSPRWY